MNQKKILYLLIAFLISTLIIHFCHTSKTTQTLDKIIYILFLTIILFIISTKFLVNRENFSEEEEQKMMMEEEGQIQDTNKTKMQRQRQRQRERQRERQRQRQRERQKNKKMVNNQAQQMLMEEEEQKMMMEEEEQKMMMEEEEQKMMMEEEEQGMMMEEEQRQDMIQEEEYKDKKEEDAKKMSEEDTRPDTFKKSFDNDNIFKGPVNINVSYRNNISDSNLAKDDVNVVSRNTLSRQRELSNQQNQNYNRSQNQIQNQNYSGSQLVSDYSYLYPDYGITTDSIWYNPLPPPPPKIYIPPGESSYNPNVVKVPQKKVIIERKETKEPCPMMINKPWSDYLSGDYK